MLDPVEFGKAMASIVKDATAPLLKRIEELESRQPLRGEKGEAGERGERGADAPPITDDQIFAQVAKYLSANPPPKGDKGDPGANGSDGAPANPGDVVRELIASDQLVSLVELRVKEEVAKIPAPKDGKDGAPGEKGERGEPGPAGKDAEPVDVAAVIRELIGSDKLLSLVELRVKEAVAEIPLPKDGKDGDTGPQGPKGEKGEKGEDGAGIQDLLIDRDGNLIATMTDGRMKSLGTVMGKDGAPGRDGKDGADFSDVRFEHDGERTIKAIGKGGEIAYRFPVPIDRGYWREGRYEKSDVVTEGGTAYIALEDTSEKPSPQSKAWRILARKGRDGKDGRNGIDKTAPVKIKKDDPDA